MIDSFYSTLGKQCGSVYLIIVGKAIASTLSIKISDIDFYNNRLMNAGTYHALVMTLTINSILLYRFLSENKTVQQI